MPEKPTPKWAADVIKLLSLNPLRVEILRQLAQQPEGITSGDIGRAVGARYKTVAWHLRKLEDLGAVDSDAGDQRQGQRVLYTLAEGAFDHALETLRRYVNREN
ncbi:ArsR/SmtB family transcription factor [Sinomonas sp.]|jgi:DNA-binding transcriptional ArsR family regulator|uniref:ArsR/SmtB family transcription factor n=1 Tax=Sinomonas sp. TaxID=1914986 RepID=UPI002FDFA551